MQEDRISKMTNYTHASEEKGTYKDAGVDGKTGLSTDTRKSFKACSP
jgi:hypothetical protein